MARFRRRLATTGTGTDLAGRAAVAASDTTNRLPRIAAPTLLIAGQLDAGTPPAMSETMVQPIPDARLAVLPNASHLSAVEQPEQFAHVVTQFMPGL